MKYFKSLTVIIFLFSSQLLGNDNYDKIKEAANKYYDLEFFEDAEKEYTKLTLSKIINNRAIGYLGIANSTYWQDGKENQSLKNFNILLENKKLIVELSTESKISIYQRAGWLNNYIENYPQAYLLFNLAINKYEKYFSPDDENFSKENYCNALYDIAWAYDVGQGISQNYKKAYENYLKSSNYCNESESMNNIGVMFEQGLYVEQNFKMANKWYIKGMDDANKVPSLWAKINYAYLMASGFGVDKNITLALEYINEVINSENADFDTVELAEEYKNIISSEDENKIKSTEYIDNFVCDDVEVAAKKGMDVSKGFQTCLKSAENNNSSAQY